MGHMGLLEECPLGGRNSRRRLNVARRTWAAAGLALALWVPAGARAQGGAASGSPAAPGTAGDAQVQLAQPLAAGQSAPLTITYKDALDRAQKNDAQFLGAQGDAKLAHEDRLQARAALLPNVDGTIQYLGTQGNGKTPVGRFVTNDGVHVYRAWAVVHQDLSPGTFMQTGYHRATAAEAIANAKAEIARRGLAATVTKNYYALVVAQRKYATAQLSLDQALRFFNITQDTERVGQGPHSDVVKAEIQYRQQEQAFDESKLAMENGRLDLAVLLFATLNENFSVVDDLDSAQALPPFPEVQTMAAHENPDLRVAIETLRQADLDVTASKTAFFGTLIVDADYGIEANEFALHSVASSFPELGKLPNLGYFLTVNLTVPVWDWGSLRSKLHQSEIKQEQAKVQLTQAQRQTLGELYAAYNEAIVARSALDSLRHTADLAAESLRLTLLRYQGAAATVLDVVDAQTTLTQARNAYDDGQVRYRQAIANLQTLTGTF